MRQDVSIGNVPPQSLEAEQSILGAILLDNRAILKCIEIVSEVDFYRNSHRIIFSSMNDLFDKSEPIDIITLGEQLQRSGSLEAVGGPSYIARLASHVPTTANIVYHCNIVREKSILRELIKSAQDIDAKARSEEEEADDVLDFAEREIFDISGKRMRSSFVAMKEVVSSSFKMIEELHSRKETITGVGTGFRDLDEMTTGFQKGDLVVVGGRPSMGKTAFSLNLAQHVAVNNHEPVAIFSLEMSTEQLVMRMLCSEARVDSNKVRKGFIGKEDWSKLTSAAGRLSEAPIFIDDSANINVTEMRAKARRLKLEHGLRMVVVDYLQLMRGRSGLERREQEISDITRSLKGLAKDLEVPVIALSQLNRGVELRTDKRPTLADLRESGAIEQDADVIIFLYRDEVYNKTSDRKGTAELIVAKQRNGPVGTVNVAFRADRTRFEDLAMDSFYGGHSPDDDGYDEETGF